MTQLTAISLTHAVTAIALVTPLSAAVTAMCLTTTLPRATNSDCPNRTPQHLQDNPNFIPLTNNKRFSSHNDTPLEHIDLLQLMESEEQLVDSTPEYPPPPSDESLFVESLFTVQVRSLKPVSAKHLDRSNMKSLLTEQESRIIIPVRFDGQTYDALLDTGASSSCIRHDIALKHGRTVEPVDGSISLADEAMTIPRIGLVSNVEIQYGPYTVSAPFDALNCHYPFIIGIDLFNKLGFSISGYFASSAEPNIVPDPDELDDSENDTSDSEDDPEFQRMRQECLQAIEEKLQENAAIPKNSHCPIPGMELKLD
ncbi:hypothetical protein BGW42_008345, partial [Actinomortierella wolfii]